MIPYYLVMRGVLFNPKGEVLMLQRSRQSRHFPLQWEFPGGKVNSDENFMDGLHREFFEETGLKISVKNILGSAEFAFDDYKMAYLFVQVTTDDDQIQISLEHEKYKWVGEDALKVLNISAPQLKIRDVVLGMMKS